MLSDIERKFTKEYMFKKTYIAWRKDIICDAIYNVLKPKSLIDVGCSIGELVQGFKERGVYAKGLDGSRNILEYIKCDINDVMFEDLSEHIELNFKYDVATCFEVFGILPQEHREQAVKNLCGFSDRILVACSDEYMNEVREHMSMMNMEEDYFMATKIKNQVPEKWRVKDAVSKIYNGLTCFGAMDD